MTSAKRIPGLPFDITDDITSLVSRMATLDPSSAPLVEPALLGPFWGVGDFVNISGPPACGKSHLAADVILGAVLPQRQGSALGGLLQFDLSKLEGGPIAIIDGENNEARWNSIIHRKLDAEGVDPQQALRAIKYLRPSHVNLHNPKEWAEASDRLAKALAFIKVRFVIIDTLARMWGAEDINSAAWVQQGLVPFREACHECGISALLLSHTKRRLRADDPAPTGPIGTSFQEGQIDGQIIMGHLKGGFSLVHQKSRRSFWIQQSSKVTVQFSEGFGYEPQEGWQSVWSHECPDYDAMSLGIEPDTRTKIAQLLKAEPTRKWASSEIAEVLGLQDRSIRHHLSILERAGSAHRCGQGAGTRWRAGP